MNRSTVKTPMPAQSPDERVKNFCEVELGYTEADARAEADRCLNCKAKHCREGCPVGIDIPSFIQKIKDGDYDGAYAVISQSSSLAAVCGRVCPQETQCECKCVRGKNGEPVAIGRLERFVADRCFSRELPRSHAPNGRKVAVVGSGPAGLSCAAELNARGYDVTVFEALHTAGGVLVYGIPEFRLPKKTVAGEINRLIKRGVKFELNTVIGKTLLVDELFADGFEAVFIGSGAGLPNFMNIEGEQLNGVYSANEYLTRINLMKAYSEAAATPIKRGGAVAVVGGGNVAMDAARCALRLGASKVTLVYRRAEADMPARAEELLHAKQEGVHILDFTAPVRIIGDAHRNVVAVECVKTAPGAPDRSGRRSPVPVAGSEFVLDADTVIMAIGTSPNPLIKNTTDGITVNARGCIVTDGQGATSRKMVFAGGDAVTGAATVILAMGAGKSAAERIDRELST